MRLIILTLYILFLSSMLSAQECTQTEPPSLLNLRLGMTLAEVNSVTRPELKVKADTEGEETFFKNWIKKPAKGRLNGIRAMYLSFFEGRLYDIELFYEEGFVWPDLEAVLGDLNGRSSLSREDWEVNNGYAEADCDGFTIKADRVLGTHIQLTDRAVAEQVEISREKN